MAKGPAALLLPAPPPAPPSPAAKLQRRARRAAALLPHHDALPGTNYNFVDFEFVAAASDGRVNEPWPAQLNKLVWEGDHDLILSIGQCVPHEVLGMANYNKNMFVGVGGAEAINFSHFIGAVYGMERMMGRGDNPLRQIFNYASDKYLSDKPVVYALTVIGRDEATGNLVPRGLFVGDDVECFTKACALSIEVNFTMLEEALPKVVVFLEEDEFHSTWLGNKALYRTRMAIADGGDLVVLAPGVKVPLQSSLPLLDGHEDVAVVGALAGGKHFRLELHHFGNGSPVGAPHGLAQSFKAL
jgi:hypothetical protein